MAHKKKHLKNLVYNPVTKKMSNPWNKVLTRCNNQQARRPSEDGIPLTEIYLDQLYTEQNGKCALTGLDIILLPSQYSQKAKFPKKCPWSISVDRIDNNYGYFVGNVQLVCHSANLARNSFEIEQIKEWFETIRNT